MTGATLSRRVARIENSSAELELRAVADRDADVGPQPDRGRRAAEHAGGRRRSSPTTACSGSSSAASRLRGSWPLRAEGILRADVHPARRACRKSSAAGWPPGPGCVVMPTPKKNSSRSASAGAARRKHSTETCGLSGRSKLPWPSPWHARARCEHSCLAREVERRESVRPASRERSAREQSAAATPLSVSAAMQRVRGPEALRHRLSTVLPLVRRRAVCRRRAT